MVVSLNSRLESNKEEEEEEGALLVERPLLLALLRQCLAGFRV